MSSLCPSDIGANPSAEEEGEDLDASVTQVIDIVDAFRLNFLGDPDTGTRLYSTKKDYMSQLKGGYRQSTPRAEANGRM